MTQTTGYVIAPQQAEWTAGDWLDSFEEDVYAESVMRAADEETGLLGQKDLDRLLDQHGEDFWALCGDLHAAQDAGHPCLPALHAGQALTWLGY